MAHASIITFPSFVSRCVASSIFPASSLCCLFLQHSFSSYSHNHPTKSKLSKLSKKKSNKPYTNHLIISSSNIINSVQFYLFTASHRSYSIFFIISSPISISSVQFRTIDWLRYFFLVILID